jgi:hypothetical protein
MTRIETRAIRYSKLTNPSRRRNVATPLVWLRPLQGTTQRGPPTVYLKRSPGRVRITFPREGSLCIP